MWWTRNGGKLRTLRVKSRQFAATAAAFILPHLIWCFRWGWPCSSFFRDFRQQKTKCPWAIVWRCLRDPTFSRFNRTPTCDRRTDGQTHDDSLIPALASVARVIKTMKYMLLMYAMLFLSSLYYINSVYTFFDALRLSARASPRLKSGVTVVGKVEWLNVTRGVGCEEGPLTRKKKIFKLALDNHFVPGWGAKKYFPFEMECFGAFSVVLIIHFEFEALQSPASHFAPVLPPGESLTSPLPCQLWPNMWSATKREAHNLLHCRQSRTKPRPQLTRAENFVKFGHAVFEMRERQTDRQTDRHRDVLIAILSTPTGGQSDYQEPA